MKTYLIQYNVGKAKYLVSFYDGIKTHNDGSPFFEIRIFKNKTELDTFIDVLKMNGYKEKA